ncbi:uncharacterized protein [Narcine bancroftii]|uniref:uncharacterized protein isoform X1 n=1 Tax=Narcine bancroftii TaxID=1343680 RepID=UPI003831F524
MELMHKEVMGLTVLFSAWIGTAEKISFGLEKHSTMSSSCLLELRCSMAQSYPNITWYQGNTKLAQDHVSFGNQILTVSLEPGSGSTIYKCSMGKNQEMTVDVGPTCGFLSAAPKALCSMKMVIMKVIFLVMWFSALGFTLYFCRETSQATGSKQGWAKAKGLEEATCSPLGLPNSRNVASPQEGKPEASLARNTRNPIYQDLNNEVKDNNYCKITQRAAGVQSQDLLNQALDKDEEDYSSLKPQAAARELGVNLST